MTGQSGVRLRRAVPTDAERIAALHADSWRRHYRGAFSDAYLDGDVVADRRAVWTRRLDAADPSHATVVAEDREALVGFGHTVLDEDPGWGALVDNLHVVSTAQGRGIGTRLMAWSADAVLRRGRTARLHLWVLEDNLAAQAFYEARGGRPVEREASEPPGGGTIVGIRYVWPDPTTLLVG
jgi:ribosomal protein S18 acetylase RimI-like enzyme